MARVRGGGKAAAILYFLTSSTLFTTTIATPSIAFPFNSQVPSVARVNQPYNFQLSPSTFAPATENFIYSLSAQPAWLNLDIGTLTLSGTPASSDVGASSFTITAADATGAAHMSCVLVVSADPAPRLQGDITAQLAATANLSSSDPPVVTLLPSTGFHFSFRQSSFIDAVDRRLYYYATLSDHTPLPSWLSFDATSLTFSGQAPVLSAVPQSWMIELVASDVAGFAGATAAFVLAVGNNQLSFQPSEQDVEITAGSLLNFTALAGQLEQSPASGLGVKLTSATTSALPSWASFDNTTLAISGKVPAGCGNLSVSVSVTDALGDSATTLVHFVVATASSSFFAGSIGTLTAYPGQAFLYHFPDTLFSQSNLDLSVTLPESAQWLGFQPSDGTLRGRVPRQATPTTISALLVAEPSPDAAAQTQGFTIEIKAASNNPTSSGSVSALSSQTQKPTGVAASGASSDFTAKHLSKGVIAAIVVLSLLASALLLAILLICLGNKRRGGCGPQSTTPTNPRVISKPLAIHDNTINVTTSVQRDVEKQEQEGEQALYATDAPPQIALDLPSHTESRRSKWLNRFSHMSQVSSIGKGEEAIRADGNIPEWGEDSAVLQTPHDSFSVPAEMARLSRQLSQTSPTKRALMRLRDRRRSRKSIGLGIDIGEEEELARHSSRRSRHGGGLSSIGLSAAMDRSSQGSLSTRGTSLLSTRPTDFPRPPTRSSYTLSRSLPTLALHDTDRHKSIRLVVRSDSIADNRSVHEKRRSFIRNRASTSLQSPLFAHGSRASSDTRQEGNESKAASSVGSMRRSRRGHSMMPTYSESSSLEPQRQSKRLSQRVRSVFAANYPRAITQSSLGADDEGVGNDQESGSGFETISSSPVDDFVADLAKPRHQRSWVLPNEASPTPPPAPPASRQPSSARRSSLSSSPLPTTVIAPSTAESTRPSTFKFSHKNRRSILSEPLSLVSNDSLSKAKKLQRPKLVHTASSRPVSVEQVKRLSSMEAEVDTGAGAQLVGGYGGRGGDHDRGGLGLEVGVGGESRVATQTSVASGPIVRLVTREPYPPRPSDIGADAIDANRKFGKHIQKRQLEIPEYASSFVDYKALKKLIKKLSATPILPPSQQSATTGEALRDSQAALQANKATFFFRLDREIDKVDTFYLQKEAELRIRLRTLLDKKRALESRSTSASKLSSGYVLLDEGFRLFSNDLDKLQQFVEVNQTAFSKILKKWDKTSKSRTKELYLSRAVEVRPCFNREVISELSDQATTGVLELQAWAEGEKITYTPAVELENKVPAVGGQDEEIETQVLQAVSAGNGNLVREWTSRATQAPDAKERISRVFLNSINTANLEAQDILYATDTIDYNYADEINERNCMHEAAVCDKVAVLRAAIAAGADVKAPDVYGRIPLHYACMHGRMEMIQMLTTAAPDTLDTKDLDNFTPLIHGVVHAQASSVQTMLELGALVNPLSENDHIPLCLACQYGTVAIVDQLLVYNPQILPDAEGLFPQHLVARFGGDKQILCLLKDHGVDMNQADKLYSWTPLFHAASEGHLHCLQQLLEFHVNADVPDEKGLSAVYYAAWEGHLDCMQLLAQIRGTSRVPIRDVMEMEPSAPPPLSASTPAIPQADPEIIPLLSLPPPIVPLRRYGHNFLDTTKTFISLSFDDLDADPIEFYGDSKYPAARLTISSKSSDLIPRNVPLPVQDDSRHISFQIENLSTFSIDFDIYPTFGSKVIARAAASSRVFTGTASSSGIWHLELFDPRLRAIGRISFRYQVVTPFHGIPLEITHFATYWKATSQYENHPSNLITGSSLSGDFMRLFVQCSKDGVPVLYNEWALPSSRNDLVSRLTYSEFKRAGLAAGRGKGVIQGLGGAGIDPEKLSTAQRQVARSYVSLADALTVLPPDVNLELHICYPSRSEEEVLQLGPTQNINAVADAVLTVVFDHARQLRESKDEALRSFVFSSYNPGMCTALNWKQPNYPILLCNELGVPATNNSDQPSSPPSMMTSCGRASESIKEAVRIAKSNNFMGLVCTSRLLELVPALVNAVKEAGLVLISDYSRNGSARRPSLHDLPLGADGLLVDNAVLRFKVAIDQ
ncbi:hypothetical protein LTR62_005589 [Meristemomyces frigidus]|uniref:Uncharacterized protein n=1 Tax=Meristemomyces frigidus TaxID=1508187 RepID=A0AAN7YJ47_9PEZI|nr:hypothetical protein LTR62_005589 [Meristemomyces frigidus]